MGVLKLQNVGRLPEGINFKEYLNLDSLIITIHK
jgi:hypothetical protein